MLTRAQELFAVLADYTIGTGIVLFHLVVLRIRGEGIS
jgi:hypothetical protein